MLTTGATSVAPTVWLSLSVAVVPSSSVPTTVTTLVWVSPTSSVRSRSISKLKDSPGFSTIGPPLAASATGSRSPNWSSVSDVIVSGSVDTESFVIVMSYVAVSPPSSIVAGPSLTMATTGAVSTIVTVASSLGLWVTPSLSFKVPVTVSVCESPAFPETAPTNEQE